MSPARERGPRRDASDPLLLPGPKSSIHSFKNNVIIVSPPFVPTATSTSQTVRNLARSQPALSAPTDVARLAVMDLDTQVLNYSGTFKDGVRDIFCLWGSIFVLGNDGKVNVLVRLQRRSDLNSPSSPPRSGLSPRRSTSLRQARSPFLQVLLPSRSLDRQVAEHRQGRARRHPSSLRRPSLRQGRLRRSRRSVRQDARRASAELCYPEGELLLVSALEESRD